MTAMATSRRYAFHAVGALGAIELTAPGRSACVAKGLRRLGLNGRERHYFELHAVLDVKHSEAWNREALRPLVAEDPRRARAIAEGALIRLGPAPAASRATGPSCGVEVEADAPSVPDSHLIALLAALKRAGYRFVTPTPATHWRVIARLGRERARDLRDAFGWNLPFERDLLDPGLLELLEHGGALDFDGPLLRSKLRVGSFGDWLFLHSCFPTSERDAVFFGPDSYRFADLIREEARDLGLREGAVVIDIGGGTGVGAMVAASLFPSATVSMTEINPAAIRLACANAAAAGMPIRILEGDDLAGIAAPIDLAVANPPYIADGEKRTYRDGGGGLGGEVSLAMARMAAERLAPGGRLILYTGSAITGGEDGLHAALTGLAAGQSLSLRYRELDPDVFGEELERPAYAEVERIALVAAILDRPA